MDLDNDDGQDTSASPTGNEDGSETAASPTDDSSSDSSTEEEQTSLEALNEALSADDTEGDDQEGGKQDVKADEEKKDDAESDKAAGDDSDNTKADELSEEALLEPLPEGTPVKTAERFEKLTEGFKELKDQHKTLTTESEGYKQYHDDHQSIVQYSGATPEEFNDLIEYSHMVKSGNLEGALAALDAQRAGLAIAMGKPLPGVNLFENHPDLQEQIDSHTLSEDNAAEIVKSRDASAQRVKQEDALKEKQNASNAQKQSDDVYNKTVEQAQNDVMAMVGGWEKNDINFSAKQAAVIEKVEEIGQKYPPEQWAEVLQLHYDAIKVGKQAGGKKPTPLRPGGNGGGGEKVATTSLDALEGALGSGS